MIIPDPDPQHRYSKSASDLSIHSVWYAALALPRKATLEVQMLFLKVLTDHSI
jgi:hypothetical protein